MNSSSTLLAGRLSALFLIFECCFSTPPAVAQTPVNCPLVQASFGDNVKLSGDNHVHISIRTANGGQLPGPLKIRFFPTDTLAFTPELVDTHDGGEADIDYRVAGNNPGLGLIHASFEGGMEQCPAFDQPVNLGFRDRVHLLPALDLSNLQAGESAPMFFIRLANAQNADITAAVPLTVRLTTSLGTFGFDRTSAKDWSAEKTVHIGAGNSRSEPLFLRMGAADSGSGTLYVQVGMSSGAAALIDGSFAIYSRLSSTRLLFSIAAGAVLWWLVSTVPDQFKTHWNTRQAAVALLGSLLIALLAFLVGPKKLGLDQAIDQTTVFGAMTFGLMAAAVGLDGILKKFIK